MISFYPGPSKIYPEVGKYMQQALKNGVLSINHRSKEFVEVSKKTIYLLKKKLNIPENYSIFFTSSATECWEIIAQSLTKNKSFHIYNGAFGEKWYEYAKRLHPASEHYQFIIQENLPVSAIPIPDDSEIICLVQNETSNGTQVKNQLIAELKNTHKNMLIAVDATSSMSGIKLEFQNADIWLASVQKCFGLPAGLGILICSPAAIQKAKEFKENNHYNSLTFMNEKMKDWQTTYTPNVLGIYLLQEVVKNAHSISVTDKLIRSRYKNWYAFLSNFKEVQPLIDHEDCRSHTVITLKADEERIKKIKEKAKKEGILLGNGYGEWNKNTFRIANFPAITDREIKTLQIFFKKNIH